MTDPTNSATFGQYQILETLNESGTAFVYKAFQPSMNRFVALKVLAEALAKEPAYTKQFHQRTLETAELQHSGILPLFDSGTDEGRPYMVMPYLDSGTLRDRLPWLAPPKDTDVLALIQPVASVIDYAHSKGVIHGNLRPSHIFFGKQGEPIVSNFGYSAVPTPPPSPYMSPEQIQGAAVDGRTDVYALGAVLYEYLINEPPPMNGAINPRRRRPDLSEDVEKVILKAISPDPNQRFQTAGEMSAALAQAMRPAATAPPPVPAQPVPAQPVPAQPQPAPAPVQQSSGGNGWLYFLLGAAAILIIVAVMLWMSNRNTNGDQPVPAVTPPPIEQPIEPTPEVELPVEPTEPVEPVEPTPEA